MRTLHLGLRVTDLDRSLAFYKAVGYEVVGTAGDMTMLKLPGDEFVALEVVAGDIGTGAGTLNHFVIKVESIDATVADLRGAGLEVEDPRSPDDGILTTLIKDPDGNRIELVQWPPGHADGLSAADWA